MGREDCWAFPGRSRDDDDVVWEGITIQEYFAAMAMQGLLASGKVFAISQTELAKKAVKYADALIEEIE